MLPLAVIVVALLASIASGQFSQGRITNRLTDNFESLPAAVPLSLQRGPRQDAGSNMTAPMPPPSGQQPPNQQPPPQQPDQAEISVAPAPESSDNHGGHPPMPMPGPPGFPWPDMDRLRCGAWNEWENATCWWPSTSWEQLPAACSYLPMPEKLPEVLKSFIESKVKEKYNMIVAEYQKRGSPPVCGYCAKSFRCRTRNETGQSTNGFRPNFCKKKEIVPMKANCSDSAPCSLELVDGGCPPPMFLDLKRVEKVNKLIQMGDDEGTAQVLFDMGSATDQGMTSFADMQLPGGQEGQRGQRRMKRSYYDSMYNDDPWSSQRQYPPYQRQQQQDYSRNNYGPSRQGGYSDNYDNNYNRRSSDFGQNERGNSYNPQRRSGGYDSYNDNYNMRSSNNYGRYDDGYSSYNPRGQEIFTGNWGSNQMYNNNNRRSYDSYDRNVPMHGSSFDDWGSNFGNNRARDAPMRFDDYRGGSQNRMGPGRPEEMSFGPRDDRRQQGPSQRWDMDDRSSRGFDQRRMSFGPQDDRRQQGPSQRWDMDDRSFGDFDQRRMPFGPEGRGRPEKPFGPGGMDGRRPFGPEQERRGPGGRRHFGSSEEEMGHHRHRGPPPPPPFGQRDDRRGPEPPRSFDRDGRRGSEGGRRQFDPPEEQMGHHRHHGPPPSPQFGPRDDRRGPQPSRPFDRDDRSGSEGRFGPRDDRRGSEGRFGPSNDRWGPEPPRQFDRDDRRGLFDRNDRRGSERSFEFDEPYGPRSGRGGSEDSFGFEPQFDSRNGREGRRRPFGPEERGRGFGPEERGRGFEPEERGRRFGPEERGRGFEPEERGRRFGPEERGRGFGPEERGRRFGPEERGRGFGPEERGRGFGPEERGRGFGPEERGRGFGPEERGHGFGPEGRGRGFGPEERGRGFGPEERGRGFGPRGRGGRGGHDGHRRGSGESHEHQGSRGDMRKHHFSFLHELIKGTSCASTGDKCLCCCGHYIPDVNNNTCVDVHSIFKGIDGVYNRLADSLGDDSDMSDDVAVEE